MVSMQSDFSNPHGFAYIEFSGPEEAENAMKHMDGGQIDGQVKVKYVKNACLVFGVCIISYIFKNQLLYFSTGDHSRSSASSGTSSHAASLHATPREHA